MNTQIRGRLPYGTVRLIAVGFRHSSVQALRSSQRRSLRRKICRSTVLFNDATEGFLDRDQEKEDSRKYRRTVFDHKRWASHRSTKRYWRHLDGVLTSRIVRGLLSPLLYVASISVAVSIYEPMYKSGALHEWLPQVPWVDVAVSPMGPFSISTFALSLLLVFRTNSSYDRWLDARRIWGNIVNRCRDMARQASVFFPEDAAEEKEAFVQWVTLFPIVLMCHLREGQSIKEECRLRNIQPEDLECVVQAPHGPVYVLTAMTCQLQALQRGHCDSITGFELSRMDEGISALHDAVGGCERIFRTPIPLSYTRHTSRFLVVWLTYMPFCIYEQLGLATPLVAMGMSFFLLGIDEIGVQLEEPFSIMSLETLCDTINKTVSQTVQDTDRLLAAQAKRSNGATCRLQDELETQ